MSIFTFESINKFISDRNTITKIEPLLLDLKSKLNIKDDEFYNIMIATTEAVNNAVNHGNKLNPNKYVDFNIYANENELIIFIKDEGEGFNPDEIDDCLQPENLLKTSGRGVFLIKELMDEVFIDSNYNGTKITMKYYFK
jgi:serine/threonine-protein kinase RsbW